MWRLAITLLALLGSSTTSAHEHAPPWLNGESLDKGLSIVIHAPSVLRTDRPFPLSVQVRNIDAPNDVLVQSFRLDGNSKQTPATKLLPAPSGLLEKTRLLQESLHTTASRHDRPGTLRLAKSYTDALRSLTQHAATAAWIVDPKDYPEIIRLKIEVQLADRTIERTITVPRNPPLPTGGPPQLTVEVDRDGGIQPIPSPRGATTLWWLAGDQHVHTTLSIDAAVLDGTEEGPYEYAATAQAMGLSWIVFTDHSNIHGSWFGTDYYTEEQFNQGQAEAQAYRADNDWLAIYSQEMGLGQQGFWDLPSHMLMLPLAEDLPGIVPNPSDGLVFGHAECESEQVIIDRINDTGAFGFIAHPYDWAYLTFYEWDWNNGTTGWAGMEIWCDAHGEFEDDDQDTLNTWHNLLNSISPPTNGELPDRSGWPTRFPVAIGNSDAHEPGLIGQTLTYAAMPDSSRESVQDAMLHGRCVASNGPLAWLRVNGAIPGSVALLPNGYNLVTVSLRTNESLGYAGDYQVTILVNGEVRQVIEPTGIPLYAIDMQVNGLGINNDSRFITLRIDRSDGQRHAFCNPIWLQMTIPGDLNGDNTINVLDLLILVANWGDCSGCTADIDHDGTVGVTDILALLAAWTG
ncbi:MAG: CehA/McbA family metallohydrolase [Phycisphaerales bacterium]|nr:CehA/McbA family metallohydrolase [Phycisphaerales bacterium]